LAREDSETPATTLRAGRAAVAAVGRDGPEREGDWATRSRSRSGR